MALVEGFTWSQKRSSVPEKSNLPGDLNDSWRFLKLNDKSGINEIKKSLFCVNLYCPSSSRI